MYVMTLFRSNGKASGSNVYLYDMSSKEQKGDVITFTQFEEGGILTETRNDAESGDESDNESIMMIKQDMENLDSSDESDHDLISTEML